MKDSFHQQKSKDTSYYVNNSIHSVTSSALGTTTLNDSKAKKKKIFKKVNNKSVISSNKSEKETQGFSYPNYLFIQNNTIGGNMNYGCFPPNYLTMGNYGYMTPQIPQMMINPQYQQHIQSTYQQQIPTQFQPHNPYLLNQNNNFNDRHMSMNINEQSNSQKFYDYPQMGKYK